ncbi:phospholipase-like protein, partial [Tanacetum coccineum]
MYDNFQIQFGREEFCLVTGLKFGVEYSDDYDDNDKPIPFRRRVFPSCLDGKRITGKDVEDFIESKSFKKLDNDDAVSLCCIGILQLVLLGLEDRRAVPNWILRLANDRDVWDDYPWNSYVWPTLYYQQRDANVKRWLPLYATEPTNEDDKKSIVAWTSNKKFYRLMLRDFLHGRVPAERLIADEEQRSRLDQMMKQGQNIFEQMKKYIEELNVDTRANREPIIADQHYGISDLSGFQSIQGGPSPFQTPTNNSIFNMGTPTNWQTSMPSQPGSSNWQSQIPAYTPTPNWQPLSHRILVMLAYATRFTDRRVEINNLMVLHDHPLIDYGKYAFRCMIGADMKKCVYLKSVRDELLRSMEEKRQLMTKYKD